MSYDINILVNGSRCKQYNHNGKVFIEAKQDSEYTIEIKNNTWRRILAVCSVDGLDILNGKKAIGDGPGYVVNSFDAAKFDGFRYSNERVAKFVFDYKNEAYAATKGDNSEKNVGVIGVRLFEEQLPPPPKEIHHHHHHDHWRDRWHNPPIWNTPLNPPTIWCESTYSTSLGGGMSSGGTTLNNNGNDSLCADTTDWSDEVPMKSSTRCCNPTFGSAKGRSSGGITSQAFNASNNASAQSLRGFDMGTKWGDAKESRVIEVEFEKGILALTTNIYYASRQSLLEMGVPLGNEKQVSFPEPFTDSKYAKPPKNWRG